MGLSAHPLNRPSSQLSKIAAHRGAEGRSREIDLPWPGSEMPLWIERVGYLSLGCIRVRGDEPNDPGISQEPWSGCDADPAVGESARLRRLRDKFIETLRKILRPSRKLFSAVQCVWDDAQIG